MKYSNYDYEFDIVATILVFESDITPTSENLKPKLKKLLNFVRPLIVENVTTGISNLNDLKKDDDDFCPIYTSVRVDSTVGIKYNGNFKLSNYAFTVELLISKELYSEYTSLYAREYGSAIVNEIVNNYNKLGDDNHINISFYDAPPTFPTLY